MLSVSAHELKKNYGAVKALKGISFDVSEGEIFGFIGPDGAGKSSLFRILTTLLLPDAGQASVCGLDVVKDYKKIRKIIGYMPGKFSLYQDLSVEENLSFFASVFETTIESNYHLIKEIYSHIEPFKKRRAGQLSGGMKQKLALSCALIHKPNVLFMDEPTTGIDAVSRKEFWSMLKGLKKEGISIVVSTPYMDEASLCDRVALLQDGIILKTDTPNAITDTIGKKVWAISSESVYKLMCDLSGYGGCYSVYPFGQMVHYMPADQSEELTLVENFLKERNHRNISIEIIEPTVEDCFMELMRINKEDKR